MSQSHQEQFEQSFQQAVQASLKTGRACPEFRARLVEALAQQAPPTPPAGLSEEVSGTFQERLNEEVHQSQQWAADDDVCHRVETALSDEAKQDLLSERSRHRHPDQSEKSRYLETFRQQISLSQQRLVAPDSCRTKVLEALRQEQESKVVPLPVRSPKRLGPSFWKRALLGVGSVAAGFAFLMGTLVGSAEKVLADSVRQDHQRCCSAVKSSTMKRCASVEDSDFGPLPKAKLAQGWELVASKVCRDGQDKPMVHNVYANQERQTISLHFWPVQSQPRSEGKTQAPRELAGDDFPVLAWDCQGWTITACSNDVDAGTLAALVQAP